MVNSFLYPSSGTIVKMVSDAGTGLGQVGQDSIAQHITAIASRTRIVVRNKIVDGKQEGITTGRFGGTNDPQSSMPRMSGTTEDKENI